MKISKDKRLHFIFCMLIAFAVTPILGLMSNWYTGAIAGLLTAMGAGAGKEFGDSKSPGNRWDWHDIMADMAGAVIGASVGSVAVIILEL